MFHGDQHVLHHMVLLVQFADGLSLRELQQRDLRRNHPAEHIPEQRVIPKWNDVLKNRQQGNGGRKCDGKFTRLTDELVKGNKI